MQPGDLTNLSLRELENLRTLHQKILDLTVRYESEFIEKGSRKRLEEVRNAALDKLIHIQKEIKKRST